jgi:hypothetical protein
MSLDADENFIRSNFYSLLLTPKLKAKTGGVGAEWSLIEFHSIHAMPRNIEFSLSLEKDSAHLRVSSKINRETNRFSNIKVEDF